MDRAAVLMGLGLIGFALYALTRASASEAAPYPYTPTPQSPTNDWGEDNPVGIPQGTLAPALPDYPFYDSGPPPTIEPVYNWGTLPEGTDWTTPATSIMTWTPPAAAAPYLDAIRTAEADNGLPENLLARLLDEESRYRPEIINGTVISSAGAIGIAQIVPKWHPGVNPYDPFASITYAGRYLRQLYNQFGSWSMALAAYNWGPTILTQKGFDAAPAETRDYVTSIIRDIPAAA